MAPKMAPCVNVAIEGIVIGMSEREEKEGRRSVDRKKKRKSLKGGSNSRPFAY